MKGDFIRFLADSLIANRNPSHCSDQCDLGAFCLMFKLQERVSIKPYYLFYSDYILHLFWQSKDPRLQNQSSVQKNPLQVPSDYCVRLLLYIELTTFFSDWRKVHSYSLSRKTVNARENFWNVYCFATNQTRDETAKDNRQTAEWINHDLTRNNELAFSSTRNL